MKQTTKIDIFQELKNIKLVKKLKPKIKEYSAKKRNVKDREEYSVLKPLTNSDSPSVKSKGARFVSARIVSNHRGIQNTPKNQYEESSGKDSNFFILNLKTNIKLIKKMNLKITSYEITWAEARIPPKIE